MIRKLFVLSVAAAAAVVVSAGPASAFDIGHSYVLPPPPPDLIVSGSNAESFTVTNLPCGSRELCMGGPGAATAYNFRVRISNGYFTFAGLTPWPHWVTWTTSYDVASLAPGASVAFPFALSSSGLCNYVYVDVDVSQAVAERNETNNRSELGYSQPSYLC